MASRHSEQKAGALARFALENGRLAGSVAKPKLFEPNRRRQLSVFRSDGLEDDEIRRLGIMVAKQHPSARRLYGWGCVSESDVEECGLRVEHDNEPERHANIVDWPADVPARKARQQALAACATVRRLNPPHDIRRL